MICLLSCSEQPTDAKDILIEGEALTQRIDRLEEQRKKAEEEMAKDILVLSCGV